LTKIKVQSLSVFADITNAYIFTNYASYDPEGSIGGDNLARSGVDYFAYPNPRVFTLGARLSF
jgi:hypothetical protein